MRAKVVNEVNQFQRGLNPKNAMDIGVWKSIKSYLENIVLPTGKGRVFYPYLSGLQSYYNDDNNNLNLDKILQVCAADGKLEFIQFLIEQGVDVDGFEYKPLRAAIFFNQKEVVKFLLEHGAHVTRTHIKVARRNAPELVDIIIKFLYKQEQKKNPEKAKKYIKYYPQLFNEGVADKYAEKEFYIPDENISQEKRFKKEIKEERPIAYVDDKYEERIPIYLNPKNLNDYDKNVRAIGDKNGNLFIAFLDYPFNHRRMANALNKANLITLKPVYNEGGSGVYAEPENFILLNRCEFTNKFILSDSYEWVDETFELLDALRKKNPQFKFSKSYYCDEESLEWGQL
ncbi:MAG: ankyrin repeat domain-containing protein [Clostridia bacterium]